MKSALHEPVNNLLDVWDGFRADSGRKIEDRVHELGIAKDFDNLLTIEIVVNDPVDKTFVKFLVLRLQGRSTLQECFVIVYGDREHDFHNDSLNDPDRGRRVGVLNG